MVETDKTKLPSPDIRTDEETAFDTVIRVYSSLVDPMKEKDNPDALFANGWGRRGHFALLVAPSGVGKSVISTQALVPWALGKPALFGSEPLMPLRVALIQAEDDDTEMAEFRRDHRLGHVAEGLTLDEVLEAEKRVWDWSPFFRGKVGADFLRGLELALRRMPMDVVILNPLQSYTDIDLAKNKEITEFLRNGIDPILTRFRVFMLCVHHTNKPQIDKTKGGAFGDDAMAAYVGAGGAELTNYARSVTFIRRCTPKECSIENAFMLIGAKRGNRLGWKDAEGKRTNRKIIAYSEDYIHWRVPTAEEIEAAKTGGGGEGGGGAESPSAAAPRISVSPDEAAAMIAAVVRADWPRKGVYAYCRDKLRSRLSCSELKEGWNVFEKNCSDFSLRRVDDGRGAYHFENDPDAAQAALDLPDSQPNYGDLP